MDGWMMRQLPPSLCAKHNFIGPNVATNVVRSPLPFGTPRDLECRPRTGRWWSMAQDDAAVMTEYTHNSIFTELD